MTERKSILNDVSIDEMMTMREEQGMTNQEIADALGVSYWTIKKYIGPQPKGLRKAYTFKPVVPPMDYDKKPEPEPEEEAAGLVVQNKKIELHGLLGIYSIDCKSGAVTVGLKDSLFEITQEEVETLITELKAIRRNSKKLIVTNEIW